MGTNVPSLKGARKAGSKVAGSSAQIKQGEYPTVSGTKGTELNSALANQTSTGGGVTVNSQPA